MVIKSSDTWQAAGRNSVRNSVGRECCGRGEGCRRNPSSNPHVTGRDLKEGGGSHLQHTVHQRLRGVKEWPRSLQPRRDPTLFMNKIQDPLGQHSLLVLPPLPYL